MTLSLWHVIVIQRFRTDRCEKTEKIQIRLLLEEQSDQGLHCLPFHSPVLHYGMASLNFKFKANILGV